MSDHEPKVNVSSCDVAGGGAYYLITATGGKLRAILFPIEKCLALSDFFVDPEYRRRGIGKALVTQALRIAENEDAASVAAAIVSRECLDVMRSVFGEDALRVTLEGEYSPPGEDLYGTSASLDYRLEP